MRQATTEEIRELPYWEERLSLFFTEESDDLMILAKSVAEKKSTDKKHSTGAVVVENGNILSKEANQAGFKHRWSIKLHESGLCLRRALRIPSGQKYWLCPGCSKSKDHAESRASRMAVKKKGSVLKDATLYLFGHYWCCKPCSDAMVNAGIKKVVLLNRAKNRFKR